MKTNFPKMIASALLFMAPSAQALEPEMLYGFQLGPRNPSGSLVQGSDGHFYGTTSGDYGGTLYGSVFKVTTNGVLTSLVSFNQTNGWLPNGRLVSGSDGNFYGTTFQGGSSNYGTVFKVTTNGVLTTLVSFTGTNGAYPHAGLLLGGDGSFYGTTYYTTHYGGGYGTVFRVTTNGVLTSLVSFFGGSNGANPADLVQGLDGSFYGTTAGGGSSNVGTVFKMTTNGVLSSLASFNHTNGAFPQATLVLGSDANFYGTTAYGGTSNLGTVFKVATDGVLTSLVSFNNTNGASPSAELVLGTDGSLYGTTTSGGRNNLGTIFRVTTDGVLTTLLKFNGTNGANPYAGLVLGGDGHFYGTTISGGTGYYWGGYGTMFRLTANGLFTTLVSFDNADGSAPQAGLTLGSDGHFYGTTSQGGANGVGTVFQLTSNKLFTTLALFTGTNGANPRAELTLGNDSNLYGTTVNGGSSGYGTVFKVTTNGVLTTMASFNGTNGSGPSRLVLGPDGSFYGTTRNGGRDFNGPSYTGSGTVFNMTTNGVFTSLVSFADGSAPNDLVFGADGYLYGTTTYGGSNGSGTMFRVTTSGVLTTLLEFIGTQPYGTLAFGSDGNVYGMTHYDDHNRTGSVFKVATNGVLTTLDSWENSKGAYANGVLVLGADGALYGTTACCDSNDNHVGTVFRVTTSGVWTTMVSFINYPAASVSGLVIGDDGYFYGTTSSDGPGGGGTIFRVAIPGLIRISRQPAGNVLLTGTGPFNAAYRLWASADLSLPIASWTLLTSASFDSNGSFSYTDAGTSTNSSRFYQLSVP